MNVSMATVSFAAIVASLIALPAPPDKAAPAAANTGRLSAPPAESRCSQQNWPNFEAGCLRYTDKNRTVRDVRIAVGDPG